MDTTQTDDYIFEVTADNFQQQVIDRSATTPVLVDFWADWCEPCKMLMPVLQAIIERYQGQLLLAKVNTDQEQMLAMQLGIRSLPTGVLFKQGQPVEHFTGVHPESEILKLLAPHVTLPEVQEAAPGETDHPQLQQLIQAGEWESALAQAAEMEGDEADLWRLKILLAQAEATGETTAAQSCLDNFSEELRKNPQAVSLAARLKLLQQHAEAEADVQQAIDLLLAGTVDGGMEQLLQILAERNSDQSVRQALIAGFDLLGDPKQAAVYRRRMATLVF